MQNIRRDIYQNLIEWKSLSDRKPLLLQGARQVGKTWLLKEFGKNEYADVAYFNFDEQPGIKQFFEETKDVSRIIQNLSLVHGKNIKPRSTLLILDEIQEGSAVLNSLKYFKENAPEYHVVGAGSLLGVALARGNGFPVGQVSFKKLFPVSFKEFLQTSSPNLATYLQEISEIKPIPDIFFSQLVDQLKMYFISGGMPEAVITLIKYGVDKTESVLQDLLNAYKLDFSKYIEPKDIPKVNQIWESLPSQLGKENKKFIYKKVKSGARSREYEDALLWLINAGLIYRVYRSSKPSLPLTAYDDLTAFKTYMHDIGLLRKQSGLDPSIIKSGHALFTKFKGALTENFILQHLVQLYDIEPRYWTSGNQAEIDFLIQDKNRIIPVEVKSDVNIRSKSMMVYNDKFYPDIRIRYSLRNLEFRDGLLNIPLFMVDETKRLIKIVDSL